MSLNMTNSWSAWIAAIKERAGPTVRSVEYRIREEQMARLDVLLKRAARRGGYDDVDASRIKGPEIGAIIHITGHNVVLPAVASQKDTLDAVDCAFQQIITGCSVRCDD
uniref:Uncharacterized protein n=1 Tax=Caenorhabditis japonica TaxID=281687 RepID=A0A8R1IM39_CAEJA